MIKEVCQFIVDKTGWQIDFDAGANEPNIGDEISTPTDDKFIIVDYVLESGAWDGTGAGKLWIKKDEASISPELPVCGWLDNEVITNDTLSNQLAVCEFTVGAIVTSLIIGDTLQMGHRTQDAPDACDVVIESSGGSIFFELPERADVTFQVLSRAKTYMTARDRSWMIYDAIFRNPVYGSAGWGLPLSAVIADKTYEIMIIEPLASPQWIGQDEKGRYEFSCNYLMKIKKL